jgi:hypothetical protein
MLNEAAAKEVVLSKLKELYPDAFKNGAPKEGVQIVKLAEAIASLIPYIVTNNSFDPVTSQADPSTHKVVGKII